MVLTLALEATLRMSHLVLSKTNYATDCKVSPRRYVLYNFEMVAELCMVSCKLVWNVKTHPATAWGRQLDGMARDVTQTASMFETEPNEEGQCKGH